jgi:hypothetical protein
MTIIIITPPPAGNAEEAPAVQIPEGMTKTSAATLLRQAANNLELEDS